MPAALFQGNSTSYPLGRRLAGLQNRSGHVVKRKILSPCQGSNPYNPARSPATEKQSRYFLFLCCLEVCYKENSHQFMCSIFWCTSTPQYVFMAWCLVKHRENFAFLTFYSARSIISEMSDALFFFPDFSNITLKIYILEHFITL